MSEFIQGVAKKVREARKAKGLTLRELGERCNMDWTNICRLESGNRDVYISTLKTIADALDKQVEDFM